MTIKEYLDKINYKELIFLILTELIIFLIIGLKLGEFFAAVKFAFSFFIIFYLAPIIWVIKLEYSLLEKFTLANVLGLSSISIIYFLLGLINIRLNEVTYLTVPISIFIIGLIYQIRK